MKLTVSPSSFLIRVMMGGVFVSFLMFFPRPVTATLAGLDLVRLLRGITLLGVVGVAFLLILSRGDLGWMKTMFRGPIKWYVLYAGWAAVSVGFSGDRFLSAAKVFELGVGIIVVVMISHWVRSDQQLDRVWRACMLGLATVVAGYMVISLAVGMPLVTTVGGFPKYSGFGGGPDGANGMAQIGSILTIFGISRSMTDGAAVRPRYLMVIGIGFTVMLLGYSRGSFFIFALLVPLLLARSRRYLTILTLIGVGVAGVIWAWPRLVDFVLRGQDLAAFVSLTGRVNFLWVAGLAVFTASPVVGHGYYYGTTYLLPLALVDTHDFTISNVDNTFLEVAMNLGLVGLGMFLALWVAVARVLGRLLLRRPETWQIPMVREAMLMIAATFIRSWINPTIAYHHWNTFVFLVAVVIITRTAQLKRPPAGGSTAEIMSGAVPS